MQADARKTMYAALWFAGASPSDDGEAAAKALVTLFEAGQVRRVVFPCKDANDTIQEMGSMAAREAIYAAKELRPDGIKSASAYQGLVLKPPDRRATDTAFATATHACTNKHTSQCMAMLHLNKPCTSLHTRG